MNITTTQQPTNIQFIKIGTTIYVKYSYIKRTYKITGDRLRKWRLRKGVAKLMDFDLEYVGLGKDYLYNLEHIEKLVERHLIMIKDEKEIDLLIERHSRRR